MAYLCVLFIKEDENISTEISKKLKIYKYKCKAFATTLNLYIINSSI